MGLARVCASTRAAINRVPGTIPARTAEAQTIERTHPVGTSCSRFMHISRLLALRMRIWSNAYLVASNQCVYAIHPEYSSGLAGVT
jgi:hypothetical protein